jgi:hypothetical protein
MERWQQVGRHYENKDRCSKKKAPNQKRNSILLIITVACSIVLKDYHQDIAVLVHPKSFLYNVFMFIVVILQS